MKTSIAVAILAGVIGLTHFVAPKPSTSNLKLGQVRTDKVVKYPYSEIIAGCYFVEQVQ